MPEKYRTPLVLFYREDQSVAAVAEALGLSKDATKQRLKRGRDELRDQVESTLGRKTLRRTAPTAVFTVSVATAISALTPSDGDCGGRFIALFCHHFFGRRVYYGSHWCHDELFKILSRCRRPSSELLPFLLDMGWPRCSPTKMP